MGDLDEKIEAGFEKLFSKWERSDLRIVNYREKEVSDADAHDQVLRSMDADAVDPSALPRVLKEYREPCHEEFMRRDRLKPLQRDFGGNEGIT